ncbi:threonine dehydratase [Limibaculum sp. M0105]|uniref:Threonine dehydratase n=1 Tax=Thermohalobaculum xanthum TaxID=2753746 RepID=A0A8J7MAZ8_9RHOB|nr:threonine dehydratase [Thermohalobaculum xanthum]MBK0400897.1 threonine dehydratase [Thermohalobaculum xanthum]
MSLFTLAELESAAALVHRHMPPTPQYAWPLLARRVGAEVWVKHENHTPTGAFKVRGGLVYLDDLARSGGCHGIVTATRGNHGQSIPYAARAHGIPVRVYVPHGNSTEKNRAMEGWGAELLVHGRDFEEARIEAVRVAETEGLHLVPPFHPLLVRGVATYGLELFRAVSGLEAVYVPIGMGSGICGLITARDLLGLKTEIIGVVSDAADAYARSFEGGRIVETANAITFADGMACRVPWPEPLEIIRGGAARVVRVSDAEVAAAIATYFADTHNIAEGAGAAPLAALVQERDRMRGKKVGVILSGGNIDRAWFRTALEGDVPRAA